MIAIIDYDTGNLRSVANALTRLGAEYVVTADHDVIRGAERVILPGVGEASSAMQKLRDRGLDRLIPSLRQPILGICIGMQLMCRHSEEGDVDCLGIFDTEVRLLRNEKLKMKNEKPEGGEKGIINNEKSKGGQVLKVPHMGWDTVEEIGTDSTEPTYYYYVHSYAADICADTVAVTDYGRVFSAVLQRDNFTGVQFHPEKSGAAGAALLSAWLKR